LAAGIPADLQNKLAFPFLGLADYDGGFARFKQVLPLATVWDLATIFIFGKDPTPAIAGITAFVGQMADGDLVLRFDGTSSGNDCDAILIMHCNQVAYGTLLNSVSSDRFTINMIRYTIPDETKTAQFNNQFKIITQSLFGKLSTDDISPESFIKPEQFIKNISDVPIIKGVDKESQIASYMNYDIVQLNWSVFVSHVNKVTQSI